MSCIPTKLKGIKLTCFSTILTLILSCSADSDLLEESILASIDINKTEITIEQATNDSDTEDNNETKETESEEVIENEKEEEEEEVVVEQILEVEQVAEVQQVEEEKSLAKNELSGYDIFLVAGQSNVMGGQGYDSALDSPDSNIYQLERSSLGTDMHISVISQPLHNHSYSNNNISFAWDFSKLYNSTYANGKKVLLINCGKNSTGFQEGDWNKGDPLYIDAVNRVNTVINNNPGSVLKGVLWHQGEQDRYSSNLQTDLDTFIDDIRSDLNAPNVAFVLGGMVPYLVELNGVEAKQAILADTPNRKSKVAYADPSLPFIIKKTDDTIDYYHFNAVGQRELAKRYFAAYSRLR